MREVAADPAVAFVLAAMVVLSSRMNFGPNLVEQGL